MAQGLTQKQRDFAHAVVSGQHDSLSDCYRHVYNCQSMKPSTVSREAVRLSQNPKVATLIKDLRDRQSAATVDMVVSDRDRILKRLRQLLERPEGTPAESISIKAASLLGQSLGLYQKRIEVDDKRELTAEELRQQIQERLEDLGIGPDSVH